MQHDHPNHDIEPPSKSQLKRDMERLQKLGARLLELKADQLAQLSLSDEMRAALREMGRIKSREARRRHLQYIGKLMRSEDEASIREFIERQDAGSAAQKRFLHELENWRDRLIAEGDGALGEYLDAHPTADRQQLRQLIRNARREHELEKPPAASRKLFRYLRDLSE